MRRYAYRPKHVDPKGSGTMPGGLSGRDMALRISGHPEHETGETPRGWTRRPSRFSDDLALFVIPQWHRQALCAGEQGRELPWIASRGRPADAVRNEMVALCHACPVWEQCLEEATAIEADDRDACIGFRAGLTANERRDLLPSLEKGLIYFGWGRGLVKIGTVANPYRLEKRAQQLRITILATEPGHYSRERSLHKRFADHREHGEWFRPADDLLSYIADLPDQCGGHRREVVAA